MYFNGVRLFAGLCGQGVGTQKKLFLNYPGRRPTHLSLPATITACIVDRWLYRVHQVVLQFWLGHDVVIDVLQPPVPPANRFFNVIHSRLWVGDVWINM